MRLLFSIAFCAIVTFANAQSSQSRSISYIEMTSSWVHVYDESGKNVYTDSRSRFGDVVGYSSSFFIVRRGGFYVLYDANIKTLNTLVVNNIGEILSVVGNTFTARNNSFITTYDNKGKRIRSRVAQWARISFRCILNAVSARLPASTCCLLTNKTTL